MTDYSPREVARLERLVARKGVYPMTFRITPRDKERLDRLMQHFRNLGLDPSHSTVLRCALVSLDKELGFTLASDPMFHSQARERTAAIARGDV